MKKFKVHIARTYTERYAVEVRARNLQAAKAKAVRENDEFGFNWNNVECDNVEVMGVDDARGRELFSRR